MAGLQGPRGANYNCDLEASSVRGSVRPPSISGVHHKDKEDLLTPYPKP